MEATRGKRLAVTYHGTSTAHASSIDASGFRPSRGKNHWLGPGLVYVFEDYERGLDWAHGYAVPRYGGSPVVYRLVVDLSDCLDLTQLRFQSYMSGMAEAALQMLSPEELETMRQDDERRGLDSFVLSEVLYSARNNDGTPRFRSVRAIFAGRADMAPTIRPAAGPLYSAGKHRSWFDKHDHIQIAVSPGVIESVERL